MSAPPPGAPPPAPVPGPTVSVIVPTLNQASYLSAAIESIFRQTFTDREIIVVDGGSTDGTWETLRKFAGRVMSFRQSGEGVARAKNEAFGMARGEFIAFLDSDDLWYPEKLEVQVTFMRDHPEFGFCSSDVDFFNESGTLIEGAIRREKRPHSGEVFADLLVNNFISSATILLRRECFEAAGGFDEDVFYAEDTDLWLRVARRYQLGFIPRSLARYRVRPDARSQSFARHYASLEAVYARLRAADPEYFARRPGLLRAAYAQLYRRWSYRHFEAGEYSESRRIYLKALHYAPLERATWAHIAATFLPPKVINRMKEKRLKTEG